MVNAAALVLLLPSLWLAAAPPRIERPVTDPQGLLSAEQTEEVSRELVRLREQTGAQMAVLIVDSTEGEPIEDYSIQAFRAWGGGQTGENNGLLYVLAVKDRRMRLEVGYGLEEHLPDDAVRRLLDAQGPLMRERDYTGAITHIIQGAAERLPVLEAVPGRGASYSAPRVHISQDAALVRVTVTVLLVSLLLCFLMRPEARERMGMVGVAAIGGLLIAASLVFLYPLTQQPTLDHGTLLNTLSTAGGGMLVGGVLLRHAQARVGASVMMGTLVGHVFALTQDVQGGELLLGTLLVSIVATVGLVILSLAGAAGLLSPLIFLGGGARIYAAWLQESASTDDSETSYSSRRGTSSSSSSSTWLSSSSSSSSWDSSSSSSSSWDSSSSSSSSWDSSSSSSDSSSSSSSDWSGGGGDSGGGGSSSSW